MFIKILSYDRHLINNLIDEVKIGIVYQDKYRTSLNVKNKIEEFMNAPPLKTIESFPCTLISIDAADEEQLKYLIENAGIDILYVAPLRAFDLEIITSISRKNKITTLTGIPEYVDMGIALGLELKGDKPRIIVNLTAAKAEGADFSSRLLKLARVIEKDS